MNQLNNRHLDTNDPNYSCWQLLPAPEPCTVSPPADYFYERVAKHLVKDTVRITSNGLGIDLNEVMHLEDTIDESIDKVRAALQTNPIILQYFDQVHARKIEEEIELQTSKLHTPDQHLVAFKHSDQVHRSYFMHLFAQQQHISEPPDLLLPSGVPKWPANLVKKFTSTYPLLDRLLKGTLSHPLIDQAMQLLAEHKCDMYNSKYLAKINSPNVPYPTFNPRSPDARTVVFTDILGFESNKLTDGYKKYERELERAIRYNKPHPVEPKNKYSWGRKQLEQLLDSLSDPDQISLVSNMIEFSFGDKIKSSFIPAFYKYTVNGRLYSNLKLLGAKSARYTSSNPNMLQLPSTGSIYAKAVKKCFVASPGNIILTADFNALEDRVMASITRDPNKTMLQLDPDLDGHLFHATMYFKSDFERICGKLPHRELTIKAKQLMDAGNKEIKDLRQKSKSVTFGASYGAFPPKIANSINCSLEEGEQIFNAYHKELYPKITEYRENYVLPTAKQHKKLHLGLGFYINTKDPDSDIRTLANASIQFWSILSILAINELHRRIDLAGYQSHIRVISSIYDSIYLEVTDDPAIIQWANNNLIECMTKDFMPNQSVPNTAESEIGYSWASLKSIPNNASTSQILATRHLLLHKDHEINTLQGKKEKTPEDFARITLLWDQLIIYYESQT